MVKKRQKDVLVSTELAEGLVAVLNSAIAKKQLKGREKHLASAYAELLAARLLENEDKARITISVQLIANILRIILMILVPDPLIRGLVEFLGRMK